MEDTCDYLKSLLESDAEQQANLRWVTCKAPGCLAVVPGAPQLALTSVRVLSEPELPCLRHTPKRQPNRSHRVDGSRVHGAPTQR
jgi:hypothetical protein